MRGTEEFGAQTLQIAQLLHSKTRNETRPRKPGLTGRSRSIHGVRMSERAVVLVDAAALGELHKFDRDAVRVPQVPEQAALVRAPNALHRIRAAKLRCPRIRS